MSHDAARLSSLVERVYEASVDQECWPRFLDEFGRALDSHVGMVWANDFRTGGVEVGLSSDFGTTVGLSDHALAAFDTYYGERNVWLSDERRHSEGAIVVDEMLYPGAQLVRTEYFTDWLRPQDVRYTAAAIVEKRNDRSVNVTLARSERAGPYRPEELRLFQLLMPHFKAAFDIHRRLHRVQALAAQSCSVLEALPFGVVLLDPQGCVLHATTKAVRMAERSGRVGFTEGQPPRFVSGADAARMARQVDGARTTAAGQAGGAGGLIRLMGGTGSGVLLHVVPLPLAHSPFGADAACAIFVSEDGQAIVGSFREMLAATYSLTPTEARLAEALVNGVTVKAYADSSGVTLSTARTQVQSIMRKAGVTRQADLVRAILTGPAVLQWPAPT